MRSPISTDIGRAHPADRSARIHCTTHPSKLRSRSARAPSHVSVQEETAQEAEGLRGALNVREKGELPGRRPTAPVAPVTRGQPEPAASLPRLRPRPNKGRYQPRRAGWWSDASATANRTTAFAPQNARPKPGGFVLSKIELSVYSKPINQRVNPEAPMD